MNSWLFYFGIIAGIIGGMGMGGGTILIPLLTIFLSVGQVTAQGINLISFFALASVALIFHFKNKLVDTKYLFIIIASASLFAVAGSFCAYIIPANILRICFGSFLILISLLQFYVFFTKKS